MNIENKFISKYKKWKDAVKKMLPYSKSTAYTSIPEYHDIISLGADALPFLLWKLERNEGMDFFLADAVIAIKGWDIQEFPQTDLEKKRLAVIERLKKVLAAVGYSSQ